MQQNTFQRKTLTERVIHAVSFEGLATLSRPDRRLADAAFGS
jgi:uncharacterized membrane protein